MQGRLLAVVALAAALSGCVREARIAVPSDVAAATERLELSGMGGGNGGSFRLAGASGRFTRSSQRLGLFDPLVVARRGGGSFSVTLPDGELSGDCQFRERELNAGPVSVATKAFAYRCDFRRDGRPIAAALVLEESRGSSGALLSKRERRGSLFFEGRELGLRSIHKDAGGGLATAAPLGYALEADGRQVGAIDLNGTNKTLFVPVSGAEREAAIAAGLALSILWDAAEV